MPQTITSLRREDVPVEMGIVVDNSGSMRDKRGQINQAVLESGPRQQSRRSDLRGELRTKPLSGSGLHLQPVCCRSALARLAADRGPRPGAHQSLRSGGACAVGVLGAAV